MSYTYLQEQGEESSAASFADIPASVLLKLNLTPERCFCSASGTASCHASPFGTTSGLLTASHGEDSLMSCAEGSLAKTSAAQEKGRGLVVNDLDYGPKCEGSLAKWDQDSYSWKTRQCSLFGGLELFSENWPRWGMMQNGEFWEQEMPELHINETESGFWPTPTCSGWRSQGSICQLRLLVDSGLTTEQEAAVMAGGSLRPQRMKTWDTPCKGDAHPRAYNRTGAYHGKGQKHLQAQAHKHLTSSCVDGGKLNPTWVEWLMGWPMTWTALQPLETAKFQQWLRSHGKSSTSDKL